MLGQRNAALESGAKDLETWNERFAEVGARLRDRRAAYVERLRPALQGGFHPEGERYDVVLDIERCLLQSETMNTLLDEMRQQARERRLSVYDQQSGEGLLRFVTLREIPFDRDSDVSWDSFVRRYNADLANDFGNLVNRTVTMVNRYLGGERPAPRRAGDSPLASGQGLRRGRRVRVPAGQRQVASLASLTGVGSRRAEPGSAAASRR